MRYRSLRRLIPEPGLTRDDLAHGPDWFVIGGRWSGLLRETLMGDRYEHKFKATFPEFTGLYTRDRVKERAEELDNLWREFGGSGPSSTNRDAYKHLGYEDDAMP